MLAMTLTRRANAKVEPVELRCPEPQATQVRVRVAACGVCRTDLHVIDGDLPDPSIPIIPGHEIVGRIDACGHAVTGLAPGQRVGIPWLGWSCGECGVCRDGRENLCRSARYTGYQLQGGYAEYAVADARFCFPLPDGYDDVHAAPLLCAGLIGYRAGRNLDRAPSSPARRRDHLCARGGTRA